eukprot:gene14398-29911_t
MDGRRWSQRPRKVTTKVAEIKSKKEEARQLKLATEMSLLHGSNVAPPQTGQQRKQKKQQQQQQQEKEPNSNAKDFLLKKPPAPFILFFNAQRVHCPALDVTACTGMWDALPSPAKSFYKSKHNVLSAQYNLALNEQRSAAAAAAAVAAAV